MIAKERHRLKLVEYLGNPDNEFFTRAEMYRFLGIRRQTFYKHFSPAELRDIETEAMAARKGNSARILVAVYSTLEKMAMGGDIRAIREYLNRIEGRVTERKEVNMSGELSLAAVLKELEKKSQKG